MLRSRNRSASSSQRPLEALESRQYFSIGSGSGVEPLPPSIVSGSVYVDLDNDGQRDANEAGISGVKVELMGVNDLGHDVHRTTWTDASGYFEFIDLRPGAYTMLETQPAKYADGKDMPGTLGGTILDNDYVALQVPAGEIATGYLFGERLIQPPQVPVDPPTTPQPPQSNPASALSTGTIQFWHSRSGQNLIRSLGGSSRSRALGNWLAEKFPNLYGRRAFKANLTGATNSKVAEYFQRLYADKTHRADAQVMALALSCYVTNRSLAGTVARGYGFEVSKSGTAAAKWTCGSLFNMAPSQKLTCWQMLQKAEDKSIQGRAFGHNAPLRAAAAKVFAACNAAGSVTD